MQLRGYRLNGMSVLSKNLITNFVWAHKYIQTYIPAICCHSMQYVVWYYVKHFSQTPRLIHNASAESGCVAVVVIVVVGELFGFVCQFSAISFLFFVSNDCTLMLIFSTFFSLSPLLFRRFLISFCCSVGLIRFSIFYFRIPRAGAFAPFSRSAAPSHTPSRGNENRWRIWFNRISSYNALRIT